MKKYSLLALTFIFLLFFLNLSEAKAANVAPNCTVTAPTNVVHGESFTISVLGSDSDGNFAFTGLYSTRADYQSNTFYSHGYPYFSTTTSFLCPTAVQDYFVYCLAHDDLGLKCAGQPYCEWEPNPPYSSDPQGCASSGYSGWCGPNGYKRVTCNPPTPTATPTPLLTLAPTSTPTPTPTPQPIQDKDALFFLHTNHQGSVIEVTDGGGNVINKNRYFAYGEERSVQGDQNISDRKYTSQVKDGETELYYYNARYYDPTLGNFISADRVGDSLNRYAYVRGNPVKLFDPSGEQIDVIDTGPPTTVGAQITSSGVVGSQTTSTVPYSEHTPPDPDPGGFFLTLGVAAAPALILPAVAVCASNPFMCSLAIANTLNPALRAPNTANNARRTVSTTIDSTSDAVNVSTWETLPKATGGQIEDLGTHIDKGVELLAQGRYDLAYNHFNVSNATRLGLKAESTFNIANSFFTLPTSPSSGLGKVTLPAVYDQATVLYGSAAPPIPVEAYHHEALLRAEEYVHAYQYWNGPLAGLQNTELDVALYLYNQGVEFVPEWIGIRGRFDIIP